MDLSRRVQRDLGRPPLCRAGWCDADWTALEAPRLLACFETQGRTSPVRVRSPAGGLFSAVACRGVDRLLQRVLRQPMRGLGLTLQCGSTVLA